MLSVTLLLVGICHAFAGTHSLFYLYTGVSGVSNIPEVTGIAKVDDQQFKYFDSTTMKAVPRTKWIKLNDDYWNRQTENGIVLYNQYKNNMPNIMNLFNHSMPGAHTLQLMYGCELKDDDTSRGYVQVGYDGEDFISLDTKKLSWIPANPPAANFKKILDANKVQIELLQTSMEKECIEYLKKYVSYANDNMERKVSPQVSLLQKNSSSPVICHATGFYSKNITMAWIKNHEELHEDVNVSSTLPNEDGSFQKSISLSVNPEVWKKNPDVYRCVVQSVGKGKEIVVLLNENNIKSNSASYSIIVKCLVFFTITILVGCVVALAVFAAKKKLMCWKTTQVKSPNSAGNVKGSTCIEMTDQPLQNSK